MKAQIHYKEQVVTDEATVAKALENFSRVFYALSFKEREELMRLLIKSLRVSKIDPTKDALPCAIDAVNTNTPIQYYRIDIEFFIQSIFAIPHASVEANDPDSTAAKGKKIRTRMNSTFIVGLIGQRWKSGAFLIHPFKLERDIPEPTRKPPKFRILKGQHILASTLEWKSILASWPELHSADVATQVGLSAIRIRHLLKLATLHPEIIEKILSMPPNQAKKQISIRALRQLCKLDREKQITVFRTIHSG
ncbi:MAG: hypothetical protein ACJAU9_000983 [Lentimonas sp.]